MAKKVGSYVGYKQDGRIELCMDITLDDMATILAYTKTPRGRLVDFVIRLSGEVASPDFDGPLFRHFETAMRKHRRERRRKHHSITPFQVARW